MVHPHPAQSRPDLPVPGPGGRAPVARFVDQLALLGVFVLALGTGLLVAEGGSTAVGVGGGIVGGIVVTLVCLFVEVRLMVRAGTTLGLFVLGVRTDPRRDVHWYDDAADWFFSFWPDLVLAPLARLVGGRRADRERPFVRDPRARSAGGRLGRLVLVAAVLASPLPLVAAVLA